MRPFRLPVGLLGLCLAITGCESGTGTPVESGLRPGEEAVTLHVAPQMVDCVSVAQTRCLLVRVPPSHDWGTFYDAIEGFEHTPGYLYTLRVAVRRIENPPADGSSRAYRLLRVLSSQPA